MQTPSIPRSIGLTCRQILAGLAMCLLGTSTANLIAAGVGGDACYVFIAPGSTDRGYGVATGTVSVATETNCAWEVVNTNSWIAILYATNGVGNGQVVYQMEANPAMQTRIGSLMIGGRRFTIRQAGHSTVSLPQDQVVALDGNATFSVTVTNISPPFTYRWQFNGVNLIDGAGISGAATSTLVLNGVQYSQGGHYRCAVSNASGTNFSSSATLTVAPTSSALPLADALDTDDVFFWKTWSNSRGIWFGQTNTTHDRIDALECSGLAANEFASVEAKSGGPGVLSFWWKSTFAVSSDRLSFYMGSSRSAVLTNTTDWEQLSFTVPPDDVNLRWTLSTSSTGQTTKAWLDQVQFIPCDFHLSPSTGIGLGSRAITGTIAVTAANAGCPWRVVNTNSWITILSSLTNNGSGLLVYTVAENDTGMKRSGNIVIADQMFSISQWYGAPTNARISLAQALDTEGALTWSMIGTSEWFGQTTISRDGVDAAQSGAIGDGLAVTATTSVNGPGTVLFWWKVSSETNKDYLKFFVNGVQQTRISGEVDWQLLRYDLLSSTNMLKWTYSKNDKLAAGQDRGWLDQVQFIPATGSCLVAISPMTATASGNSETGTISVIAGPECAWNVVNTNAWITCPTSGLGDGVVRYAVSENNSRSSRTGIVSIGGRPFTLTQRGGIPPCSYSLSITRVSFGRAEQSASVAVTTQSDCEWNVWNTNTWITITSSLTNVGSSRVTYSVATNDSFLVRTGYVRIADQLLTVIQGATSGAVMAWGHNRYGEGNVPAAAQSGVVAIAAGWCYTVALKEDGSVLAWGANTPNPNNLINIPLAAQNGVIAIAASVHTVVLKNDGSIMEWGDYEWGPTNVPLAARAGVTAIAAGYGFTLALKDDGSVIAWNYAGQMLTLPFETQGPVTAIAAGGEGGNAVILKADGSVVSWGGGGIYTLPSRFSNVVAVASGGQEFMALTSDGAVIRWYYGDEDLRELLPPGSGVTAIDSGYSESLVIKDDGTVVEWSWYGHTEPDGLSGVTAITASGLAGEAHAAAIYVQAKPAIVSQPVAQSVSAWQSVSLTVKTVGSPVNYQWRKNGVNVSGATSATYSLLYAQPDHAGTYTVVASSALGSVTSAPVILTVNATIAPGTVVSWGIFRDVPIAAQSGVSAIAAGGEHTLALKNDGSVLAWGLNNNGQTDVPPAAQRDVIAISAGFRHSVALKSDGSVLAWGDNMYGQCSVPSTAKSGVTAIAAGRTHTVALKSDGSVIAWGDNSFGETTVPAAAMSGVVAIAAGGNFTMALKNNGSVLAWGAGTIVESFPHFGESMVPPAATSGVSGIAAGQWHSVALKNGAVMAWGYNFYGQATVPFAAGSGVTAIAAGDMYTLALKNDGTVVAWGDNYGGTVTGTQTDWPFFPGLGNPVTLEGRVVSAVTAIAGANYHTVALLGNAPLLPRLSTKPHENQLIVSWPTNASGFKLERASTLSPAATWIEVSNPPAVLNGNFTLTNSASLGPQFFRLRKASF